MSNLCTRPKHAVSKGLRAAPAVGLGRTCSVALAGGTSYLSKIASLWTMNRQWSGVLSCWSLIQLNRFRLRRWRNRLHRDRTISLCIRRPPLGMVRIREVGSDPYVLQEVLLQSVYDAVCTRLGNCETIVDLGANIGLASLMFAYWFPRARIVAVEPHPETIKILRANLSDLLECDRAEVLHSAVWSQPCVLRGVREKGDRERSDTFSVTSAEGPGSGDILVTGMTMPEVLRHTRSKRIDLLKIDIEGAEVEVFRGDVSWLEVVDAIAVEFHGDSRRRCSFDLLMRDAGLQILYDGGHSTLAVRPRG